MQWSTCKLYTVYSTTQRRDFKNSSCLNVDKVPIVSNLILFHCNMKCNVFTNDKEGETLKLFMKQRKIFTPSELNKVYIHCVLWVQILWNVFRNTKTKRITGRTITCIFHEWKLFICVSIKIKAPKNCTMLCWQYELLNGNKSQTRLT